MPRLPSRVKKVSLEDPPESSARKRIGALREEQTDRLDMIATLKNDDRTFESTGAHDTVLDYADLFSVSLFETTMFQEFDTRWDEMLLSMTKIPSDDILESLYKLRIRESDQLKTL